MIIWTSYYGNLRNIPEDWVKISVSDWIPVDIEKNVDTQLKALAPSLDIYKEYKNTNDWQNYVSRFKAERLAKIDWIDMFKVFHKVSKENGKSDANVVLLCYENPHEFCHRHILAEEIESMNPLLTVKELGYTTSMRIKYRIISATDTLF